MDDLIIEEYALRNEISEEMQNLVNAEMEKKQTKELWALLEPYSVPRNHVRLVKMVGEGAWVKCGWGAAGIKMSPSKYFWAIRLTSIPLEPFAMNAISWRVCKRMASAMTISCRWYFVAGIAS